MSLTFEGKEPLLRPFFISLLLFYRIRPNYYATRIALSGAGFVVLGLDRFFL
jgi:hypothetical protein